MARAAQGTIDARQESQLRCSPPSTSGISRYTQGVTRASVVCDPGIGSRSGPCASGFLLEAKEWST